MLTEASSFIELFVSFQALLTTMVCPFIHHLRFSYKDFEEFENGMFVKLPFSMVAICPYVHTPNYNKVVIEKSKKQKVK